MMYIDSKTQELQKNNTAVKCAFATTEHGRIFNTCSGRGLPSAHPSAVVVDQGPDEGGALLLVVPGEVRPVHHDERLHHDRHRGQGFLPLRLVSPSRKNPCPRARRAVGTRS